MANYFTGKFWPAVGVVGSIAFLTLIGAIYWQEYRTESVLSARGVKTTAVLDDTYTEYKRHGVTEKYSVTYKFNVGGKAYNGESTIQRLPSGGAIEILYNPDDPEMNSTAENLGFSYHMSEIAAYAIVAAVLAGIGLLMRVVRGRFG